MVYLHGVSKCLVSTVVTADEKSYPSDRVRMNCCKWMKSDTVGGFSMAVFVGLGGFLTPMLQVSGWVQETTLAGRTWSLLVTKNVNFTTKKSLGGKVGPMVHPHLWIMVSTFATRWMMWKVVVPFWCWRFVVQRKEGQQWNVTCPVGQSFLEWTCSKLSCSKFWI